MILDSFFAFAAVIEAAALVCLAIVATNEIRRLKAERSIEQDAYRERWKLQLKAERENAVLKAQLAKFDHDGDGKIGGSKPKADNLSAGYIARGPL